jgi:hypothetical protein
MSMFIQGKNHIDHLVTALVQAELITVSPNEAGRMLWRENLNSAKYRYPNDQDGERPGPIDFRDADVETYTWSETPVLTDAALKGAIRGYCYQACEHPEWNDSEAKSLMDKLVSPVAGLEADGDYWEL